MFSCFCHIIIALYTRSTIVYCLIASTRAKGNDLLYLVPIIPVMMMMSLKITSPTWIWVKIVIPIPEEVGNCKEVIIRSRAGSNDLLDLCAFVNCMYERTYLITFFAFQNLAQLSQLSSARSRLGQRQLEELLVWPRYQAPLWATTASNRTYFFRSYTWRNCFLVAP